MSRIAPGTEVAICRFLNLIFSRYEVESAILCACGDSDVAVLMQGNQDYGAAKSYMVRAAFDRLFETDIPLSALPVWLDEGESPENHSNPCLWHNIKEEGIRL